LTCFHSYVRGDDKPDSFCIGRGATLDPGSGRFGLSCKLRDLPLEETIRGVVPFGEIKGYWYETGPPNVFASAVDLKVKTAVKTASLTATKTTRGGDDDAKIHVEAKAQHKTRLDDEWSHPPQRFLLLKREGESNPWHCLMEIFSTWMTFDVLSMSRDPLRKEEPFFHMPEDILDTQAVILDEREDGPYFDLWTLFASRRPIRLHELLADPAAVEAVREADIIIPLAGGSNPLWQDDWESSQCSSALTVSTFSRRVISFYNVTDPPTRGPEDPIIVTFIDRRSHRRLLYQDLFFAELEKRHPYISVRMIDFSAISFTEQLSVVRDTDLLVGVHGAGLTHTMFMREGVGAVVEIQPTELDHYGFRNLAIKRGLNYFRVHADSVPKTGSESRRMRQKRSSWHWDDVRIEEARFLDVMDAAIKSMYSKGPWNYDVN